MALEQSSKKAWRDFSENIRAFRRCDNGGTAIEYSLIVSLIFLAVVAAVRAMTESTSEMYGEIESALD